MEKTEGGLEVGLGGSDGQSWKTRRSGQGKRARQGVGRVEVGGREVPVPVVTAAWQKGGGRWYWPGGLQ